jgi:hypothetical protein
MKREPLRDLDFDFDFDLDRLLETYLDPLARVLTLPPSL